MSAYSQPMSIRKLFAILLAIAVMFAPAFTTVAMASAAVPDHHAQMKKGHCDKPTGEDQNKLADMSCCGPMCMAVAVTPGSMRFTKPPQGEVPAASLSAFQTGIPAELATPPPRAS